MKLKEFLQLNEDWEGKLLNKLRTLDIEYTWKNNVLALKSEEDKKKITGAMRELRLMPPKIEIMEAVKSDEDKLDAWKEQVKKAYPEYASKMKFKGYADAGNLVCAEVPGMGKCFGIFDMDDMQGKVIGESLIAEKWNDSGASDANGRWAKYRDGKIGVGAMATWLYNSRVHKKTKEEKLKSAMGAISQQQNTSKLISAAKADSLRAELKRKYN